MARTYRENRKNVIIIIPSLTNGGAERMAGYLSIKLSEYYSIYFLLNRKYGTTEAYDYSGELIYFDDKDYFNGIKAFKRHNDIYCAISFMFLANAINVRTRYKEKVILSVRTMESERFAPNIGVNTYSMADCVVTCSKGIREDFIKNGYISADRITTIYNFIEKKKIVECSSEDENEEINKFLSGSRYILSVGRLDKVKNHIRLIRQYEYYHKNNDKNTKLIILGSGSLEEQLLNKIRELGLQEYICIIPFTRNPFVYYAKADCFVLPSDYEGFPNVLMEAMALNVPIVATDCPSGPREILDDNCDYDEMIQGMKICRRGLLCENSRDESEGITHYMADAINEVMTDEELRNLIKKEQKIFMDNYSNEDILKEWIDVIELTTANRPSDSLIHGDIDEVIGEDEVIVYGAGMVGHMIMDFLNKDRRLLCYAVTDTSDKDNELYGVPIRQINALTDYADTASVIIAAWTKENMNEMEENARKLGFKKIVFPSL